MVGLLIVTFQLVFLTILFHGPFCGQHVPNDIPCAPILRVKCVGGLGGRFLYSIYSNYSVI